MGGAATGLLLGDKTEIRTLHTALAEEPVVILTCPFLRHCLHTIFPNPKWLLKDRICTGYIQFFWDLYHQ